MSRHLALFLGRFHPVILHVPIGLILLALVLEHAHVRGLRQWIPKVPPDTSTFLMFCAAMSALVSTLLGWMLSYSGGYDPVLLQRHFLAGLLTAHRGQPRPAAQAGRRRVARQPGGRRRSHTRSCCWPPAASLGLGRPSRGVDHPRRGLPDRIRARSRCAACWGCRSTSIRPTFPGSRCRNGWFSPTWWPRCSPSGASAATAA